MTRMQEVRKYFKEKNLDADIVRDGSGYYYFIGNDGFDKIENLYCYNINDISLENVIAHIEESIGKSIIKNQLTVTRRDLYYGTQTVLDTEYTSIEQLIRDIRGSSYKGVEIEMVGKNKIRVENRFIFTVTEKKVIQSWTYKTMKYKSIISEWNNGKFKAVIKERNWKTGQYRKVIKTFENLNSKVDASIEVNNFLRTA